MFKKMFLLSLVLFVAQCSSPLVSTHQESSNVPLKIAMSPQDSSVFQSIANMAILSVSDIAGSQILNDTMKSPFYAKIQVPPGEKYIFGLKVYDINNVLQYTGLDTALINGGLDTVNINLKRTEATVIIHILAKKKPGILSVSMSSEASLKKSKPLNKTEENPTGIDTINLDTINISTWYDLKVVDIGQLPITNVQLSVSSADTSLKDHYSILHSTLTEIIAAFDTISNDIQKQDLIQPRLCINHGASLTGTGWAGLLKQGINYFNLSVSGHTIVYSDSLDTIGHDTVITLAKPIKIFANVVDFKFLNYSDSIIIDSTLQNITQNPTTDGSWLYRYNSKCSIINTGNVPFTLYVIKKVPYTSSAIGTLYPYSDTVVLSPSKSITFNQTTDSLYKIEGSSNLIIKFNSISNEVYNITSSIATESNGLINFDLVQNPPIVKLPIDTVYTKQ